MFTATLPAMQQVITRMKDAATRLPIIMAQIAAIEAEIAALRAKEASLREAETCLAAMKAIEITQLCEEAGIRLESDPKLFLDRIDLTAVLRRADFTASANLRGALPDYVTNVVGGNMREYQTRIHALSQEEAIIMGAHRGLATIAKANAANIEKRAAELIT